MNSTISNALQFHEIAKEIFSYNYKLKQQPLNKECDFRTENNICIEVKYTQQNNFEGILYLIRNFAAHHSLNVNNLIFVTNLCGCLEKFQDYRTKNKFLEKVNVITLENLLYLCNDNSELKSKLLKCVEFSTEDILPSPLNEKINDLLKNDKINFDEVEIFESNKHPEYLTNELPFIKPGRKDFSKYEKFCENFLGKVFEKSIGEIVAQCKNNDDCYRFDLIASLKAEPKNFWKFLYDKYNSLFILFECKNYSEPVSQEQIFLTERYLYDNALRNVAIILTRVGATKSAIKATQDILKEHGKLILILCDNDLKALEECFLKNSQSPNLPSASDFMMDKTKEFLLNLDK